LRRYSALIVCVLVAPPKCGLTLSAAFPLVLWHLSSGLVILSPFAFPSPQYAPFMCHMEGSGEENLFVPTCRVPRTQFRSSSPSLVLSPPSLHPFLHFHFLILICIYSAVIPPDLSPLYLEDLVQVSPPHALKHRGSISRADKVTVHGSLAAGRIVRTPCSQDLFGPLHDIDGIPLLTRPHTTPETHISRRVTFRTADATALRIAKFGRRLSPSCHLNVMFFFSNCDNPPASQSRNIYILSSMA
jgi:hypothetical protein